MLHDSQHPTKGEIAQDFEQLHTSVSRAVHDYQEASGINCDTETFLLRLLIAWRSQQEQNYKSGDGLGRLMDEMTRGILEKSKLWDIPISAGVRQAARLLDPTATVKIQMHYTPRGVTTKYMQWAQTAVKKQESVNPLLHLLALIKTDINEEDLSSQRIYAQARCDVFFTSNCAHRR